MYFEAKGMCMRVVRVYVSVRVCVCVCECTCSSRGRDRGREMEWREGQWEWGKLSGQGSNSTENDRVVGGSESNSIVLGLTPWSK